MPLLGLEQIHFEGLKQPVKNQTVPARPIAEFLNFILKKLLKL
jgi:hypothetical protein